MFVSFLKGLCLGGTLSRIALRVAAPQYANPRVAKERVDLGQVAQKKIMISTAYYS